MIKSENRVSRWNISTFLVGAVFAAVFLVTGCAGTDPELRQHPNYQLGYGDGCNSASARTRGLPGRHYRNESLYKSDEAYRAGWRSGWGACAPPPDHGATGNY